MMSVSTHPETASGAVVVAPPAREHQVPAVRPHAGVGDVQVGVGHAGGGPRGHVERRPCQPWTGC